MTDTKIINQIPFDYEDYCTLRDTLFFEMHETNLTISYLKENSRPNYAYITCYESKLTKLEKVFSKLEEYREYFY